MYYYTNDTCTEEQFHYCYNNYIKRAIWNSRDRRF